LAKKMQRKLDVVMGWLVRINCELVDGYALVGSPRLAPASRSAGLSRHRWL